MGVRQLSRPGHAVARSVEARSVLVVIAVALVWRLPSFFDPPWVNDEGTYFAIAQAMARGYRLYAEVWENKPPALYLLYAAVYHAVGASLPAVRVLSGAAVITTVLIVMRVAARFAGDGWPVAGMLCGLLMGVPFLEGTTANAEVFLIAFTSLAVMLALRERMFLAGLVMAVAILFKAVSAFDAAALGLYLLAHGGLIAEGARRTGRVFLRPAGRYTLGVSLPLLGVALAAAADGILRPMLTDALLYPAGYVGHANGGGIPWVLLLKVLALAGVTAYLIRKDFPALWLLWAASGALVSGRFFGHYALQVVPPLCVLTAVAIRGRGAGRPLRAAAWLPAVFLSLAAGSALVGWGLAASGHDSIAARRLQWYSNFVRMAMGAETYATYRDQVDDHVSRNIRIAAVIRTLPAGSLLVWGNTPWVYVLSDRLPATPYTSSLRQPEVPGETAALRRALYRRRASVVVIIEPPLPALRTASRGLRGGYRPVTRILDVRVYAARARPGRLPGR